MIMYSARYSWGEIRLSEVHVEKSNDKSVWINGRRNACYSNYDNYFESLTIAQNWLSEKLNDELDRAKKKVHQLNTKKGQLESAIKKGETNFKF